MPQMANCWGLFLGFMCRGEIVFGLVECGYGKNWEIKCELFFLRTVLNREGN